MHRWYFHVVNNITMKATKLGVWLDHHHAYLTPFTDPMTTTTLEADDVHKGKSEHLKHHAEQNVEHGFYKKLSNIIREYESVILFGPKESKNELFNRLTSDHHFSKVHLEVKQAGKMTVQEQQAFVKTHFTKYA